MSEWESFRIKDFGKVVTGKTPPTVDKEFYNKGYKFVTPTDLDFNSYYIRHTQREVSEKARNRYPNYFLPPDSVSYTCIGATIGKSCLNREYVLTNQQINSIIPNKSSNARFIYYYLNAITPSIVAVAGGAATPIVNKSSFESIKINVPPLPTQQKIAKTLSNYDDLIENNLKRIKLLEESARLTYEEWFLRFRIDGKKLDIDPDTGLPFGWEKVKLKSFCILTMGQSPKSKFYNQTCEGLPFHQGVTNYGFRFPSNTTWSTEGSRISEEGDILFSVRAPVGRLNVSIEKIILGRGLASIRQINDLNSFLFYQLQNIFFEDNLMGSGAIFDSVTKRDVEDIELIYSKNISEKFNTLTSTIDNEIKNLTNQNKFLKEARDILLPRLMTGMIDTNDMSIAV